MDTKLTNKRILVYLGITFLLTYAFEILVIYPANKNSAGILSGMATILVSLAMLIPSLGVLLTRLITKEGFKDVWLKPHFKGNIRYYVFAWFAPTILTIAGIGIYFLIFPDNFDGSMPLFKEALEGSGQVVSEDYMKTIILVQIAAAVFLGPVLNCIFCFGEEWGWRGYLLPKMMEKFSIGWVLLINGVIWGLWHAPLTVMGHNYGTDYAGWPVTGILAMCVFCIVMGAVFSYVTIRTGSCLPAIIAHGSLNGIGTLGAYFTVDGGNPFIGPNPTGVIGGAGFIITAVILAVLLIRKDEGSKQK